MERSLAQRVLSGPRCSMVLLRLRRHARCLAARGAGAAPVAASAGATLVLASAAGALPGPPDFGRPQQQPQSQGAQQQRRPRGVLEFGSPLRRCTDVLLVLHCVLFAAQWASKDALWLWGAKSSALIAAGQWWRLLTCNFLHSNLPHLLINSWSLDAVGPHAELLCGRPRFLAVYLAGGLIGAGASALFNPQALTVGASSSICGLAAALGVFYWRHRDSMGRRSTRMFEQLALSVALNIGVSLACRRIDNWCHGGGVLGGALVAWLLGPRLLRQRSGALVDQPPLPVLADKPSPALSLLGLRM